MTRADSLRRLPALVALAVALVAAGCADDDERGDTADAAVTTTTVTETTAPEESTPTTVGEPAERTLAELQAMAAATREVVTGRFEFRATTDAGGDEPNVLVAEVEFAGDDSRARSSAEGPGSEPDPELGDLSNYEILVVDGQTYLRGQIVDTIFGGGSGRWVRIPPTDDPATASALPIASPLDADSFLALVERAQGEVRSLGDDEVRGTECEHLQVTVPPAAFEAFDSADLEAVAPGLFDDARPLDVWACDDGYVHRMELTLESGGQEVVLGAELYDLGEPVEITAPEGATDIDPDSLFGGLFGAGG